MENKYNHNNIYSVFEETAEKYGNNIAAIYIGTAYTYSQIKDMAEKLSVSLSESGVHSGERVILYIPNSVQWLISWLAVQRLGGVCVPITPIYTPHDIEFIANDCQAETIICGDTNYGYVARIFSNTNLRRVVVCGLTDLLPGWKRLFGFLYDVIPGGKVDYNRNVFSLRKLISRRHRDRSIPKHTFNGDEVAQILYT